jgi:hypothetical protein
MLTLRLEARAVLFVFLENLQLALLSPVMIARMVQLLQTLPHHFVKPVVLMLLPTMRKLSVFVLLAFLEKQMLQLI